MSLTSSNFAYSLLESQTVKLESPTELMCVPINKLGYHPRSCKSTRNLRQSQRGMIYLSINLLSKLKVQEMAGSLSGH